MGDKIKVSVLEENGTELLEQTERLLEATSVDFDPSNSDLSDTDVDAAINSLAGRNFGKNYSYEENDPGLTTTSNTFVNVVSAQENSAPAGTYLALFSYRTENSKRNKKRVTGNPRAVGLKPFLSQLSYLQSSIHQKEDILKHQNLSDACRF